MKKHKNSGDGCREGELKEKELKLQSSAAIPKLHMMSEAQWNRKPRGPAAAQVHRNAK